MNSVPSHSGHCSFAIPVSWPQTAHFFPRIFISLTQLPPESFLGGCTALPLCSHLPFFQRQKFKGQDTNAGGNSSKADFVGILLQSVALFLSESDADHLVPPGGCVVHDLCMGPSRMRIARPEGPPPCFHWSIWKGYRGRSHSFLWMEKEERYHKGFMAYLHTAAFAHGLQHTDFLTPCASSSSSNGNKGGGTPSAFFHRKRRNSLPLGISWLGESQLCTLCGPFVGRPWPNDPRTVISPTSMGRFSHNGTTKHRSE